MIFEPQNRSLFIAFVTTILFLKVVQTILVHLVTIAGLIICHRILNFFIQSFMNSEKTKSTTPWLIKVTKITESSPAPIKPKEFAHPVKNPSCMKIQNGIYSGQIITKPCVVRMQKCGAGCEPMTCKTSRMTPCEPSILQPLTTKPCVVKLQKVIECGHLQCRLEDYKTLKPFVPQPLETKPCVVKLQKSIQCDHVMCKPEDYNTSKLFLSPPLTTKQSMVKLPKMIEMTKPSMVKLPKMIEMTKPCMVKLPKMIECGHAKCKPEDVKTMKPVIPESVITKPCVVKIRKSSAIEHVRKDPSITKVPKSPLIESMKMKPCVVKMEKPIRPLMMKSCRVKLGKI